MFYLKNQIAVNLLSIATWFNFFIGRATTQHYFYTTGQGAQPAPQLLPLPTYNQPSLALAPTTYLFNYGVHDFNTGDVKSQWEQRAGGNVKGQYTILDSDGTFRTVDYTADDLNGFNAVVKKTIPRHSIAKPVIKTTTTTTFGNPNSLHPLIKSTLYAPSSTFTKFPSIYSSNNNLIIPFPVLQQQRESVTDEPQPDPNAVHNPGPVLFPRNNVDVNTTPDPSQTSGVTPPPPQFIPPKSITSVLNQIIRAPETLPRNPLLPTPQSQIDTEFPTIVYYKK